MKKIIAIIVALVMVLSIGTAAYADYRNSETKETLNPGTFKAYYYQHGEKVEEELSAEDVFGKTKTFDIDYGTGIDILLCSNPEDGFFLTESTSLRFDDEGLINFERKGNGDNVRFYMQCEEYLLVTINCGTETDPNWVSFKCKAFFIE